MFEKKAVVKSVLIIHIILFLTGTAVFASQTSATVSGTGNYQLGCWIDGWWPSNVPTDSTEYDIINLGMIQNLKTLSTGSGFEVKTQAKPEYTRNTKNVLFTYGSEGGYPVDYPNSDMIVKLEEAVSANNWDGIDFDDESNMNIDNINTIMSSIVKSGDGKSCSYTFLAGLDFIQGSQPQTDSNLIELASKGNCDRYILMCYGGSMWSDGAIKTITPKAIQRTIDKIGKDNAKKVYLAITSASLTDSGLSYSLDCIIGKSVEIYQVIWNPDLQKDEYKPYDPPKYLKNPEIGGLFVWRPQNITESQMDSIKAGLDL